MIDTAVIDLRYRVCPRCEKEKAFREFHAKTRDEDGSVRTVQTFCKTCQSDRARERDGRQPRKPAMSERRRRYLRKVRYRARMRRIFSDPTLIADYRIEQRMKAKMARQANGATPYSPRKVQRGGAALTREGTPIVGAYRGKAEADEIVDAGPFVEWFTREFPRTSVRELSYALKVPERHLQALKAGEGATVSLDFVDRAVTLGLGRPDILNALYPPT